jgi:hypothetical protein
MLSLAEFQRAMVADLLDGGIRSAPMLREDLLSVTEALGVHRNTVSRALTKTLRLTYSTVHGLTGERFFDQAAAAYIRAHAPRGARLSAYGDNFPDFLETYIPARRLPYLGDVARFDLAIDRSANKPLDIYRPAIPLDGVVSVALPVSLTCLRINYPADLIRDAFETVREDLLRDIDMHPAPRSFALWRSGSGASAKPLSASSAVFLTALLDGSSCEAALAAALEYAAPGEVLGSIQSEIFAASFAQVTNGQPKGVA